jgi:DNA-directed RNA polymerase subunit alpha
VTSQSTMPQLEIAESTETYAKVIAEPLPAGFGTTIGNALRRVLLSSLPGAAVTAVRIDEVEHEFSTIPKMKEDTIEFLLNIKELRLRALSDRSGKLYLEAQGEGPVTAAAIQTTADYEIVNPELHLATLDASDARLTVELTVEKGKGYQPATAANGMPIGMIPVDAIFSPIRKVHYNVERTLRTGEDRLVLEVWTDGTMEAVEAVAQSAEILMRELQWFAQLGRPAPVLPERGHGIGSALAPDRYNTPIEDLNLSVRAYNCLKRSGLMTVGQVLEKSEDELLGLRNFGRKSYDELREKLIEMGFIEDDGRDYSASADQYDDEDEEDVDEELGSLGAALMEALRGRGTARTGEEE